MLLYSVGMFLYVPHYFQKSSKMLECLSPNQMQKWGKKWRYLYVLTLDLFCNFYILTCGKPKTILCRIMPTSGLCLSFGCEALFRFHGSIFGDIFQLLDCIIQVTSQVTPQCPYRILFKTTKIADSWPHFPSAKLQTTILVLVNWSKS